MSTGEDEPEFDRGALERLLNELHPKLHRYCARMTGSSIDGEDVLQDAAIKAIDALPDAGQITNPEGWIFRIAHNTALDFIRRRSRLERAQSDEDVTMIANPTVDQDERLALAAGLRTFMRLPVAQRSSVILKDLLGYSIEEISAVLDGATIASVKATLHRGRATLREISKQPEAPLPPPKLSEHEITLLTAYIDRFNARDFDSVRDMLAEEVRLNLVSRERVSGRAEVSRYYGNYDKLKDWWFALGVVESRPAAIAFDPVNLSGPPIYFVVLQFDGDALTDIKDFRYARYATEGADIVTLEAPM
jgi:RNA polymerase sigma-70 factor (ECF subfamily)